MHGWSASGCRGCWSSLELMASPWAYGVMAITILIDTYLLFIFFRRRRAPSP